MFITENLDLRKSTKGTYFLNNEEVSIPDEPSAEQLDAFYRQVRNLTSNNRSNLVADPCFSATFPFVAQLFTPSDAVEAIENAVEAIAELTDEEKKAKVIEGLKHLMDFFKEFDFEPNFRFVNTLALNLKKSMKSAKDYINNYFELIDSPYTNEINAKVKSKEFSSLLKEIQFVAPTKVVNHRFNLYYGSQGTGKTTIAMKESGANPIVCNSSMLPSDIMEDFVFVDGKATYKPSAFWRAMVEGRTIVMDEINLLPYDTLRFLQGILDNKSAFTYKGNDIEIHEDFKIIGTMNLTVNGMTYGLPEPLVDRCAVTKKFTLSAEDLFSAIG